MTAPEPAPLDVRELWALFANNYPMLIPGILLEAFTVEVLARAAPLPIFAPIFFFAGAWLLVGSTVRVRGLTKESVFSFSFTRMLSFLVSGFFYWVAGFVFLALWFVATVVFIGHPPGPRDLPAGAYVTFAMCSVGGLYVIARTWPAYVIAFLYRGSRTYPSRWWVAPGAPTAWLMTGRRRALTRCTIPVLAAAGVTIGVLLLSSVTTGVLHGLIKVILHGLAIPFVTLLVVDRAALLRRPNEPWVETGPAPE